MSFGFSVGDFLAGATLTKDMITALRGSAKLEYRELELELYGLQRALAELEHLKPRPDQEVAVNAVKAAALMCRYPLEEFQAKLKRYHLFSKREGHRKRDVAERATSLYCGTCWKFEHAVADSRINDNDYSIARTEASEQSDFIRDELTSQIEILTENTTKIGTLYNIVTSQIVLQLQSLVGLVEKVWSTNLQILAFFSSLQNNRTQIDIRHTWFQEPLRLEDALGRTIPIPVEYGWSTFEAIVNDQFSRGPEKEKVFAGEYEIFKTDDSSQLINSETFSLLSSGTAITMAMVIGKHNGGVKDQCPKPGCRSRIFVKNKAGGLTCVECKVWFGKARIPLPKPWRLLSMRDSENLGIGVNDRKLQTLKETVRPDTFEVIREERQWYKNIRIHSTDASSAMAFLDRNVNDVTKRERASLSTGIRQNEESRHTEKSTNTVRDIVRSAITEELLLGEDCLEYCADLFSLGVESFTWLGIVHRLQRELQVDLHSWRLSHYGHSNVDELSEDLERVCSGKE